MTTLEFSNEFDVLINSQGVLSEFGLTNSSTPIAADEYEKSVSLTQALELIVIELYNGKNAFGDSFEKTEEIRRYLNNLVKTVVLDSDNEVDNTGLSNKSRFFLLPDDLWYITYEAISLLDANLECENGKSIIVYPITQDDYWLVSRNPFRRPNKRKAIRLDVGTNIAEIISDYSYTSYLVRYLSKPSPIILVDLEDVYLGLSINGITSVTESTLNPVIHRAILERGVRIFLQRYITNSNNNNN